MQHGLFYDRLHYLLLYGLGGAVKAAEDEKDSPSEFINEWRRRLQSSLWLHLGLLIIDYYGKLDSLLKKVNMLLISFITPILSWVLIIKC